MSRNKYLKTSEMKATSSSMALASEVMGFEIVELWVDNGKSDLHCIYVHAEQSFFKRYPTIITGHYPTHNRPHVLSPRLCKLAQNSSQKYHWSIVKDDSKGQSDYYRNVGCPIKTEMCYILNGETGGNAVFIIGLSTIEVEFKKPKLEFLSGIGYAIYVAAFKLDDDGEETLNDCAELDSKMFQPARPIASAISLVSLGGPRASSGSLSDSIASVSHGRVGQGSSVGLFLDSPSPVARKRVTIDTGEPDAAEIVSKVSVAPAAEGFQSHFPFIKIEEEVVALKDPEPPAIPASSVESHPPTWDPVADFNFPVGLIPLKIDPIENLTFDSFSELTHIADGSNANVFLAKFQEQKVIIKIIKPEVQHDSVAIHEFDLEHGMLARVSHPNIIKVLGSGSSPRRFIVLEYLGGGSLNSLLAQHQVKPGLAQRIFRRPSFTYTQLLERAKEIADALDYLHSRCHEGATIIHRDLKPDNVGFTTTGELKLFDFGLVTCVNRRQDVFTNYAMTGYTGSLRYMAPEVAQRLPYNEKVDVYSYGIMVWQMARDKIPFKGYNKEEFIRAVVKGGLRPKLDHNWPKEFSDLLTSCWDNDPLKRPSFAKIVQDLTQLIGPTSSELIKSGKNSLRTTSSNRHSTWF